MEWLSVNLSMYRDAFVRAASLATKNWPVMLTVFAYSAIRWVGFLFAAPLGMAGGIVLSLVDAACFGSFLYLVEMMVRTTKVTFDDFRRSFFVYLSDVLGVMFVLWIGSMVLAPVLQQSSQGFALWIFALIAISVLFNAVPELIYLGHHSSLALLAESYQFIANNWIEWFPANIAAAALLYGIWMIPTDGAMTIAQIALANLVTYFIMVMRGLLFLELSTTSYRARVFKYRARS